MHPLATFQKFHQNWSECVNLQTYQMKAFLEKCDRSQNKMKIMIKSAREFLPEITLNEALSSINMRIITEMRQQRWQQRYFDLTRVSKMQLIPQKIRNTLKTVLDKYFK